ncbi:hypothetical protein CVT25_012192 [Psilocybe cyanescens]|uniref:Clathrin/coatomer adaptor adaptin-like N-terminal domain-containing protein n=1 Tax=Psilocybe cyanescens TaxID=93625 RepID=A0A409XFK0_PSICY|nr:hypothetical protein CVT25_012192 [Psilocybe cyanescens]
MDVPFHSSGAMSRAHYAIVRKVESAPSIHSADQYLALEIRSIQAQLSHPKLSLDKSKECLVILLYCAHLVTHGYLAEDAFDFAFSHAINLAEAATRIEDKRLGYLFCSEVMPLDHEFRLMLINTLRKDLESDDIPRICLALDNLITSPNEDVIPAVESRLHDLLSHDYACVRRRALFAFCSLSGYDRALLDRINGSVLKGLHDLDESVAQAALIIAGDHPKDPAFAKVVNNMLKSEASYLSINQSTILNILKCLRSLDLAETNIPILLDVLHDISSPKTTNSLSQVLVLGIFKVIGKIKPSVLIDVEKSKNTSVIQCIRHFLVSHNPNDVYLFVSCLEEVDVSIWAGTTPDHPAVLEGLEFERILQLLDSADQGILRKTLRIVNNVDPAILETQISLLLNTNSAGTEKRVIVLRILEIASVRYARDGDGYAQQVLDLIRYLDQPSPTQVIKEIIEISLTEIRLSSKTDFVTSCVGRFIADVVDQNTPLGPTALVISTALMTEYLELVTVPPQQLLSAIATRLKTCPPIVQEPCLIALIRIRAHCDDVPSDIVDIVNDISRSGRQLVRLLPDFLDALQSHTTEVPESLNTTPQMSRSSSRASGPSSSLKYAAYAAPVAVPRQSIRRSSASQHSNSSSYSETTSDASRHRLQHLPAPLPITAGHLALADSLSNLHISQVKQIPSSESTESWQREAEAPRADLITLESPFQMEAPTELASSEAFDNQGNFESVWNLYSTSCDLRGWCNIPIDDLIRRLQRVEGHHLRVISADLSPFMGELKILMISNKKEEPSTSAAAVALRLRESEEDSCLWRLRCAETAAGERIQTILNV